MAKKKQCESVATKSTMILRPRTPTAGQEKVKEKAKGKKTVGSGKIRIADSEKGQASRKRKAMVDNAETAENTVKRVKALNKNEMDKGSTNGSTRVLRSNNVDKGDESKNEVVKKESSKSRTKKQKQYLSVKKKEAPLATRSVKGKKSLLANKRPPLTIQSPKPKNHVIGSTKVLRPRNLKGKVEMPTKVDEKTNGKMPVKDNKKTDGKKTVATGKIKIGNVVKSETAANRKLAANKANTEVSGSRVKKLKAVMKKNKTDKGATTRSTRVLRSKKRDESGNTDVKNGSAEKGDVSGKKERKEMETNKHKKNLNVKKEATLTIRSPNLKRKVPVRKRASPISRSPKPKKILFAEANKRITRKGGKLEDPLSKEQVKDAIANKHRTSKRSNNQETRNYENIQLMKRKKVNIVVRDSLFPPEIIMEILSWLPIELFGRLMLVCKQWYALVQDRHFMEKHMSQAHKIYVFYYVPNDTTESGNEDIKDNDYVYACDGLYLEKNRFTDKYRICNPLTKQVLELPDPHKGSHAIFFSYVPSTSNYKLVSIYDDESGTECCEVLSFENNELSWRLLKMPTRDYLNRDRKKFSVVSTGDAVHCVRVIASGAVMLEEVISLHLVTEQFTVTNFPGGEYKSWEKVWALNFMGKLALVDRMGADLCVLVLEDYKKQKWGKRIPLIPSASMKILEDKYDSIFPYSFHEIDFELLRFWVKDKMFISYNIKTGKEEESKCVQKEGCEVLDLVYLLRQSLVHLKGMQPKIPT